MPVRKLQIGQVWKKDDGGDQYRVTTIYNEALATDAVLRKAGAESDPPVRVKVAHSGQAISIPGFTFTQESDDF